MRTEGCSSEQEGRTEAALCRSALLQHCGLHSLASPQVGSSCQLHILAGIRLVFVLDYV